MLLVVLKRRETKKHIYRFLLFLHFYILTILQFYNVTILQFYNFTILQFYNFTILQFYKFSSPSCGKGERDRFRVCIDGRYGGQNCPKNYETQKEECTNQPGKVCLDDFKSGYVSVC